MLVVEDCMATLRVAELSDHIHFYVIMAKTACCGELRDRYLDSATKIACKLEKELIDALKSKST